MRAPTWNPEIPTYPGYYEVWDPRRGINRIVHAYRLPNGALAIRNFCGCKYAFLAQMWELPCFEGTHWRGPIEVPETLELDTRCALPHCDDRAPDTEKAGHRR